MAFQYSRPEVSHGACAVCLHRCLGVLHHHHAVLVVCVGYGESPFRQVVEEEFLCVAVVLERLVVVQMVSCEVGEYTTLEPQSSDAALYDGMARAFHEGVFASCLDHLCQQAVEFNGVWRGV